MAIGDFRYTPRYQFWVINVICVLVGAGLGWLFTENGILSTVSRFPFSFLIYIGIFWLLRRRGRFQAPPSVEPYEHPILGLYTGTAAIVTMLALGESLGYSAIVGSILGVIVALALVASRSWRTRHDTSEQRRPIPTITGWR